MDNQPAPAAGDQNDKLVAALSYPISFIISLVILLTDMKNRPFMKFHAIQSMVLNAILLVLFFVVTTIVSVVTLGIGALCTPILWLGWIGADIYYAYLTYQGKDFTIPFVTDFIKKQGWA